MKFKSYVVAIIVNGVRLLSDVGKGLILSSGNPLDFHLEMSLV